MRIFITTFLFFIVTAGSSSDNIYFTKAASYKHSVSNNNIEIANNELKKEIQTLRDKLAKERPRIIKLERERNVTLAAVLFLIILLLIKPVRNFIDNFSKNISETSVDIISDRATILEIADRIDRTADRFANADDVQSELIMRKAAIVARRSYNLEKAQAFEAALKLKSLINIKKEQLDVLNRMVAIDVAYGDDPPKPADENTEVQDVADEQAQLTPSPPPLIGSAPLDNTYVPPPPIINNDNNELQSWDSNPVSAGSVWDKIPFVSSIKKMYQDHISSSSQNGQSDNTEENIVPAKTEDVVSDDFIDNASMSTSDPDGVASRLKTIRDVPQDATDNVGNALSGNYQSPEEIDNANDEMNSKITKDIAKSVPFVRSFSDVMDKIQSGGNKLADYGTKIKNYFFKSSGDPLDKQ